MAKTQSVSTPAASEGELAALSTAKSKQGTISDVEKLLGGQFEELLKTGGVGAYLPIIMRALERTKAGTAKARTDAETQLAQQGLGGTPFAGRTLAEIIMQGELAEANVPTDFFTQIYGSIPEYVTNQGSVIANLLSTATQAGTQRGVAATQAGAQLEATELQGFYQLLNMLQGLGVGVGTGLATGGAGFAGLLQGTPEVSPGGGSDLANLLGLATV